MHLSVNNIHVFKCETFSVLPNVPSLTSSFVWEEEQVG
jgi:hypothetical protein